MGEADEELVGGFGYFDGRWVGLGGWRILMGSLLESLPGAYSLIKEKSRLGCKFVCMGEGGEMEGEKSLLIWARAVYIV